MSTRGRIAFERPDGTFDSIYIHYAGEMVGKALEQFFNDQQKAIDLINLGAISYIEEEKVFAYHRDRGEPWAQNAPQHSITEDALHQLAVNYSADFIYIYRQNGWEIHRYFN